MFAGWFGFPCTRARALEECVDSRYFSLLAVILNRPVRCRQRVERVAATSIREMAMPP
jgi:hypothetical protein